MKHNVFLTILLAIALVLTACGSNPVERLSESVIERGVDQIFEQATGLEIERGADGSIVVSGTGDDGGRISGTINQTTDNDRFEGMGFNIPLPAGLTGGTVQKFEENGEDTLVQGSYQLANISESQLVSVLHDSLIGQGFFYVNLTGDGREQPAPDEGFITYAHLDGYQFSLIAADGGLLLSLIKSTPSAVLDFIPKEIVTELDGTMRPDKSVYQPGEEIQLTFISNNPLESGAWIGIVPSDTPHGSEEYGNAAYLSYAYTDNVEDNIITLFAPEETGTYDLRLYYQGLELASVGIAIEN